MRRKERPEPEGPSMMSTRITWTLVLAFSLAPAARPALPESRADAQKRLRKEILTADGVDPLRWADPTRWGEDVANPFTGLSAEARGKLRKQGLDTDRLAKMRAVVL